MRLILLRHGATEWSVSGRHTGRTDLELTDMGVQQATEAAPIVHAMVGDDEPIVISSPLQRASATAAIAFPGVEVRFDDDLVEMDYGDDDGLTTPQIRAQRPGWDIWRDGCPAGEDVHQVGERADRFLARIASAPGVVVAVAHGHLVRVLAARALGLPADAGRHFALDTAAAGEVTTGRDRVEVTAWNVTPRMVP